MEKTPFDDFIHELNLLRYQFPENKKVCALLVFFQVCRVSYLPMLDISNRGEGPLFNEEYRKNSPNEYYLEVLTSRLKQKLAYFNFISLLNIYQRSFNKEKIFAKEIPRSFEINFYRNKAVEHWQDYQTIDENSYNPLTVNSLDDISIPFHYRNYYHPIIWDGQTHVKNHFPEEALCTEFKKLGVALDTIDRSKSYEDASELIFNALKNEKIRKEILNVRLKEKYEPLIKALFGFCFPLPIHSPRNYADDLIAWAREELGELKVEIS